MRNTEDRYREAGMPAPRAGEARPLPGSRVSRARLEARLRRAARELGMTPEVDTHVPLDQREHDPATDVPVLPEVPASAYGSDSVPLDTPDANTTEETS